MTIGAIRSVQAVRRVYVECDDEKTRAQQPPEPAAECPECARAGRGVQRLRFFHISLHEAVEKCASVRCMWPFRGFRYRATSGAEQRVYRYEQESGPAMVVGPAMAQPAQEQLGVESVGGNCVDKSADDIDGVVEDVADAAPGLPESGEADNAVPSSSSGNESVQQQQQPLEQQTEPSSMAWLDELVEQTAESDHSVATTVEQTELVDPEPAAVFVEEAVKTEICAIETVVNASWLEELVKKTSESNQNIATKPEPVAEIRAHVIPPKMFDESTDNFNTVTDASPVLPESGDVVDADDAVPSSGHESQFSMSWLDEMAEQAATEIGIPATADVTANDVSAFSVDVFEDGAAAEDTDTDSVSDTFIDSIINDICGSGNAADSSSQPHFDRNLMEDVLHELELEDLTISSIVDSKSTATPTSEPTPNGDAFDVLGELDFLTTDDDSRISSTTIDTKPIAAASTAPKRLTKCFESLPSSTAIKPQRRKRCTQPIARPPSSASSLSSRSASPAQSTASSTISTTLSAISLAPEIASMTPLQLVQTLGRLNFAELSSLRPQNSPTPAVQRPVKVSKPKPKPRQRYDSHSSCGSVDSSASTASSQRHAQFKINYVARRPANRTANIQQPPAQPKLEKCAAISTVETVKPTAKLEKLERTSSIETAVQQAAPCPPKRSAETTALLLHQHPQPKRIKCETSLSSAVASPSSDPQLPATAVTADETPESTVALPVFNFVINMLPVDGCATGFHIELSTTASPAVDVIAPKSEPLEPRVAHTRAEAVDSADEDDFLGFTRAELMHSRSRLRQVGRILAKLVG